MKRNRKERLMIKSINKSIKVNHPIIKKNKVSIPKFTEKVVLELLSEKSISLLKSHRKGISMNTGR